MKGGKRRWEVQMKGALQRKGEDRTGERRPPWKGGCGEGPRPLPLPLCEVERAVAAPV